MPAKFRIAHH